jgi:hypothetical protein
MILVTKLLTRARIDTRPLRGGGLLGASISAIAFLILSLSSVYPRISLGTRLGRNQTKRICGRSVDDEHSETVSNLQRGARATR